MMELIARLANLPIDELTFEYFGLNHLGWIRSINYRQNNVVPSLIQMLSQFGNIPGFHIDSRMVASLGLIPNEYLYYYYHSRLAVQNILKAGQTRGELVAKLNNELFQSLARLEKEEKFEEMSGAFQSYTLQRGQTYMQNETGTRVNPEIQKVMDESADLGYAKLALDLIEALQGDKPKRLVLNIPNHGAISGMNSDDVVEIPAFVQKDSVEPVAIGQIPDHCLGLIKQVKAYEKLTIQAAVEKSFRKAVTALAIHPLVSDYGAADQLVAGYQKQHGSYFPDLK
jgi:6-phospho-beta-glucosidase